MFPGIKMTKLLPHTSRLRRKPANHNQISQETYSNLTSSSNKPLLLQLPSVGCQSSGRSTSPPALCCKLFRGWSWTSPLSVELSQPKSRVLLTSLHRIDRAMDRRVWGGWLRCQAQPVRKDMQSKCTKHVFKSIWSQFQIVCKACFEKYKKVLKVYKASFEKNEKQVL